MFTITRRRKGKLFECDEVFGMGSGGGEWKIGEELCGTRPRFSGKVGRGVKRSK